MESKDVDRVIRLGKEKFGEVLKFDHCYGHFDFKDGQAEYLRKVSNTTLSAEDFEIISEILSSSSPTITVKVSVSDENSSSVIVNIQGYGFDKDTFYKFQKDRVLYQYFLVIMSGFYFDEADLNKKTEDAAKMGKLEEFKLVEPTSITNDEIFKSLTVIRNLCSIVTCKDCPLGYNDGTNNVCRLKDEKAPCEWILTPPGPWKAF